MFIRSVKHDLRQLERVPESTGNDTVRLWEGYRDQAYLWRGIAVVFLPVTLMSLLGVLIMFYTADSNIEVPPRRAPAMYNVDQLPDREFVDLARTVIGYMASYTPDTAKPQFEAVRMMLLEPALSQFDKQMMKDDLQSIFDTRRTQLFLMDPSRVRIDRSEDEPSVTVRIPGVRQKIIGGQIVPNDQVVFYVKMTTIPRNLLNEHGLVVTDVRIRATEFRVIDLEDQQEQAERKKSERLKTRR